MLQAPFSASEASYNPKPGVQPYECDILLQSLIVYCYANMKHYFAGQYTCTCLLKRVSPVHLGVHSWVQMRPPELPGRRYGQQKQTWSRAFGPPLSSSAGLELNEPGFIVSSANPLQTNPQASSDQCTVCSTPVLNKVKIRW